MTIGNTSGIEGTSFRTSPLPVDNKASDNNLSNSLENDPRLNNDDIVVTSPPDSTSSNPRINDPRQNETVETSTPPLSFGELKNYSEGFNFALGVPLKNEDLDNV